MKKKRTKKRRRNLLLFGIISALVMYYISVVLFTIVGLTTTSHHTVCCQTPADYGLHYEAISFQSQDGTQLVGWYIPPQNGTIVILLHGYGGDRRSMLNVANMLGRHGFGSVLYDMRGHGESHSQFRSGGWQDVADVAAAVTYLQNRSELGIEHIAIFGFSVGGQVAIHAAAEIESISAVIADGPSTARGKDMPQDTLFARLDATVTASLIETGVVLRTGVSPPAAIVDVVATIAPRPILFIAGGNTMRNLEERTVRRYYEFANQPKDLWFVPNANHGQVVHFHPEEYERRIVSFLTGG